MAKASRTYNPMAMRAGMKIACDLVGQSSLKACGLGDEYLESL
jgi:hypothetical protein